MSPRAVNHPPSGHPQLPEAIARLVAGYHRFRDSRLAEYRALFQVLAAQGQHPKVMLITCCDSRIDPALLTGAHPGELFLLRNVANLVPLYDPSGRAHGTSAAVEFAVTGLGVGHIIVLGHAHCGGVAALYEHYRSGEARGEFIPMWMDNARPACEAVERAGHDPATAEGARELERQVVRRSLENLASFPWIRERVEAGRLTLHGWYFDIESAELSGLDPASDRFVSL
jgi:carbonic anhydrase